MIGERLGKYTILETIGTGSMGVVYKAEDPEQSRPVALKLVRSHVLYDTALRERFLQGLLAASEIRHPGVNPILEIGDENDDFFVVTPYLQGKSLAQFAEGKSLPWRHAFAIACSAAEGLGAIHRGGAVHRAVKPSNIWLEANGSVLLLDCCVARFTEMHKSAGRSARPPKVDFADTLIPLGALAYMSPEQVRGAAVDHRTDIFSLAAVLYEMLTGRHPFEARNSLSRMSAILEGEPPPASSRAPGIPCEVDAILNKAMAKSPENRYQTVGEFADVLRAMQENPAPPMPATRSTRVGFGISPAVPIAVMILLLTLIAGIYYFLTLN
jgi:serine/threonine protein kinase